ncbi:anti-sigma factor family protein [Salinispora arenicola]|uniref:anti-sigma factor family protein n=1 Tax=Salinispora arenicola TaxID=168697 RepID=UPI00036E51E8|nr:zf-HC2 domain-containing protein [Salinispora arenicola]
MTRCEFAHDDGVYVLGALAPAQRAAYERHLAGCTECGHAVAEIAVLPGLLGRLDPADLDRFLPPPADSRLSGLLAAAGEHRHRERRATRRRYARTTLAAAAVALVVGLGTAAVWPEQPTTDPAGGVEMVAMRPVAGAVPVYAEIGLVGTAWGTRVAMRCGYNAGTGYDGARPFRLVAHGPDGATEQLGSWLAAPGDDLRISGATRFTDAELVRLELVRLDGTTILAYDVP